MNNKNSSRSAKADSAQARNSTSNVLTPVKAERAYTPVLPRRDLASSLGMVARSSTCMRRKLSCLTWVVNWTRNKEILHQRIYIVGVLVDGIEREYPWFTESRENLIWFKQKTGKTPEFLEMWLELLADLLRQQGITLQEPMAAEMENERRRHEKIVKVAEILRKPDAAMTAEDTEVITARVVAKGAPSSSSSRPDFKKGSRVEGDVRKGMPRAAPAVVRKISKAPPEQPPRREIPPMLRRATPPIDPPAKWAKGASKGAAERATSGSRTGKWKGKRGEKGKFNDGPSAWDRLPEHQGFGHLPAPPPYNGPARNGPPDGARQIPIRRNQCRDVGEVDRQRRERVIEPPNPAYFDSMMPLG